MIKLLKLLSATALILCCFGLGVYGGPYGAALYHKLFPPPEYKTGDYSALYTRAGNEVVMYSTSTCPYCAKVRKLFAAQGIAYKDYQVDKSPAADAEFKRVGGQFVPLLYIGDRQIDGYRETAIKAALAELAKKT